MLGLSFIDKCVSNKFKLPRWFIYFNIMSSRNAFKPMFAETIQLATQKRDYLNHFEKENLHFGFIIFYFFLEAQIIFLLFL